MTREEQLRFCKVCKNQKFRYGSGRDLGDFPGLAFFGEN
jgi:hypothetical protein